jgi:hypothetical protein
MFRLALVGWMCLGALGLGILILVASRRQRRVSPLWSLFALLLGPIFLCLILPLWLGRWGKNDS